jgi:hypothetical protein
MRSFYFSVLLFLLFCSCSKSNKQTSPLTFANELILAPWKLCYVNTVTLFENNIIRSSNKIDADRCIKSVDFKLNGTFEEQSPCSGVIENISGHWQLQKDSILSEFLGTQPAKILMLTKDSLQIVMLTVYYDTSSLGLEILDSIQTRETFCH